MSCLCQKIKRLLEGTERKGRKSTRRGEERLAFSDATAKVRRKEGSGVVVGMSISLIFLLPSSRTRLAGRPFASPLLNEGKEERGRSALRNETKRKRAPSQETQRKKERKR